MLNILFKGGLDKDKTLKQIEKDIKDITKSFGVELQNVSLKNIDKATSQIQSQINQLSKNLSININKVNLGNNGALKDIQSQINSSLKGEKINLEVKSNIKDSVEDFNILDNKIKNSALKQEQYLTQLENKLNRVKEKTILQHTKNENYDNTRDLNTIANIQNRINDIKARGNKISQEERSFMSQQVVELDRYISKETTKNAEMNRSARFLTSQLRSLESLKIRVENRGGGNKSEQSRINSELQKRINLYERMIQENKILGSVERGQIQKTTNQLKVQTNKLVRYQSQFSNIFSRMKDYFIGGSLLYSSMNAFRQGFNDLVGINSAMIEIKRVSNQSSEVYSQLQEDANKTAIAIGGDTQNLLESVADFKQAGETFQDSITLAKNNTIFQNISDMSQEQSAKTLISVMKSFNIEAKNSMDIMDKINNVSNNYSTNAQGLSEALLRSSNSLKVAGNNLDQSLSMIVASNSSLQNPAKVGNGLKFGTLVA